MKIAYFSPLSPLRSGISCYSRHLLNALTSKSDLEVFHYGKCELEGYVVHDYYDKPSSLSKLPDFDAKIYHIGNNPHYHSVIRDVLIENPGVIVLHDAVLYFLVAGRGLGGLFREFQSSAKNPSASIADTLSKLKNITQDDVLKYDSPETYPLLGSVLRYAKKVIVHSQTALKAVKDSGFNNKVELVPHLTYSSVSLGKKECKKNKIRRNMGIEEHEFIIGLFGFIGPPKQIHKVLLVVRELLDRNYRVRLLIVGTGDDLSPDIRKYGLSEHTTMTGFVENSEFQLLFSIVDTVINLRFPSSGEASGTLIHAFSHGKAAIVSDTAWFSELPDSIVKKIPVGKNEIHSIVDVIASWIKNPEIITEMGKTAFNYSRKFYSPEKISEMYIEALKA